jgi:CubicO group peptidase (beta-lactamase class C family)
MRLFRILIIVLTLLAPAHGLAQSNPHDPRIDKFAGASIKPGSPGLAVLVVQKEQVVHEAGYGLADISAGIPITPKTLFHLGSVGKQFTALGIMLLVQDGKIASYDDAVAKYIPALTRFGNGVTIRRLLNHTAGMPSHDNSPIDQAFSDALDAISSSPSNSDEITALSKAGRLTSTPGAKWNYSNTGYELLGALIERLSGQTYPAFMQQRIFGPAGMTHTFAMPNPNRSSMPNLAHSYDRDDSGTWTANDSDPGDNLSGSGATYSSLEDMFAYDQALNNGTILATAMMSPAFEPAKLNGGSTYGYGFAWNIDQTDAGDTYYWHDGSWLAFLSMYARYPKQSLSVIVLSNSTARGFDPDKLGDQIQTLYLGS